MDHTLKLEEGPSESIQLFRVVDESGRAWRAKAGALTIGSAEGNDVVLADPTVSRFHCELREQAGQVWIRDLDSKNGTVVDGVRVSGAQLRPGGRVVLGRAALRFERLGEREPLPRNTRFGALVGASPAMREAFAALEKAAPTDATVLLEGETGTGKGADVEALHAASARAQGPLVVVDCGALAAGVLESELFGHAKGAFTGAVDARAGAFEEAAGGTVFLDEIGEMPLEVQPKLLRVLENRVVRRLGQNAQQPVDVRVVAATHRDLRGLVNEGRFRADLYYRLAVVRVRIPALREHAGDLPALVEALLDQLRATPAQRARLTAPDVLQRLAASAWPGNVRELRNYLERSLVLDDVPLVDKPVDETLPAARQRAIDAFERAYLEDLLRKHRGKVSACARAAGVARVYMYRLLAKHGLSPRG